ncbi:MAG: acyl carrier protein [bacterium]
MKERLAGIFKKMFDVDELSEDMKLGSVNKWNSFAHVEMILEIENEFGISISTKDAVELVSVRAILDYLESKRG